MSKKKRKIFLNESMPTLKEVSSDMSGNSVLRSGLYSVSENKIAVTLTKLKLQSQTGQKTYCITESRSKAIGINWLNGLNQME